MWRLIARDRQTVWRREVSELMAKDALVGSVPE